MIVHTSAIVLRTVDYQESSKIVTLFSEEHGKMAVIAKGAKKPKSKFSGLLEVCHILDVIYYHKESRSVQILTEASIKEKTLSLRTDFEKMAVAVSSIELISQMLHDNEVNRPMFRFTHNFLVWLNGMESAPRAVFPYLQIRLAQLGGFGLQADGSLQPSDNPQYQYLYLNLESGQLSRELYTDSTTYKLTPAQARYVRLSLEGRGGAALEQEFEKGELKELIGLLDRYLKYHVEGMRNRRSDAIFEQMLQEDL